MQRNRRSFLNRIVGLTSITKMMGGLLLACKSPEKNSLVSDPCQDFSNLTESERAMRQQLGYTNQSSFNDRNCANCQLFIKEDKALPCGNCLAMKGPVADAGYCTVWAPIA